VAGAARCAHYLFGRLARDGVLQTVRVVALADAGSPQVEAVTAI
jgi:hypothetical protein